MSRRTRQWRRKMNQEVITERKNGIPVYAFRFTRVEDAGTLRQDNMSDHKWDLAVRAATRGRAK